MMNKYGIDHLGRPCKDLYCMNLCFEVSRKSIDPYTKHGCLAVDQNGGILSAGYNSPPQDSVDENIPLTRPEKYIYLEHSERNCIFLANRHNTPLVNSVFYITGFPCSDCLRAILQIRASKIVYGPYNSVMTDDEEYMNRYKILLDRQKIIIERFKFDEGLYIFNPRIKELISNRKDIKDINFEWNS